MNSFETTLQQATAKGANNVPGVVLAVVDKDGNISILSSSVLPTDNPRTLRL
jgi:hypothetical protein